ncbi:hypothetical protein [Gloeothece verrucosa]|nr:hypothetical protein [Gloeothece verrucosa]
MGKKITLNVNFKGENELNQVLNEEMLILDSSEIKSLLIKILKGVYLPIISSKISPSEQKELISELLSLKNYFQGLINNMQSILDHLSRNSVPYLAELNLTQPDSQEEIKNKVSNQFENFCE